MERSRQERASARCGALPWRWRHAQSAICQTVLVLTAVILWVLLFAVFAGVGGCSQRTTGMQPMSCCAIDSCGRSHCLAGAPRASLLFVPYPELMPVSADEIARADWPTTTGATSYGEVIDYRVYRYDAQGLGPFDLDYGYRTFTSVRSGQQSSN